MSHSVLSLAAALQAAVAGFDPAALSGAACAAVVEQLAATEKACAAARVRAAARAAASGAHRPSGFRDPADWLARVIGSSPGEARAALDTVEALDACPRTRDALVAGELSLTQAREITRAEAECPGSETDLVALARRATVGALRDEARRRRFAAVDAEVLHTRQRAARTFRHWRDELGMVCGRFSLPPEVGVALVNRLDADTDRIRRRARRARPHEPLEAREAHAADAFAAVVADRGAGASGRIGSGRRSADLVVVCDRRAWARGHAHPGEPCHVVGGTPVPVPVAGELAGDAFVKAVVHDGRRIDTVVHWGRHIPAEVRTALELGAPPRFDGAVCVEPGCGRRHGLEWDHVVPFASRGPTSYANLVPRCWAHHHDKTERDRAAGLLGTAARSDAGRDPP